MITVKKKVIVIRLQSETSVKGWPELRDQQLDEVFNTWDKRNFDNGHGVRIKIVPNLSSISVMEYTLNQAIDILERFIKAGIDVCVDIFEDDERKVNPKNEIKIEEARKISGLATKKMFLGGWTRKELEEMVDFFSFNRFLESTEDEGFFSIDYEGYKKTRRSGFLI